MTRLYQIGTNKYHLIVNSRCICIGSALDCLFAGHRCGVKHKELEMAMDDMDERGHNAANFGDINKTFIYSYDQMLYSKNNKLIPINAMEA